MDTTQNTPTTDRRAYLDRRAEAAIHEYRQLGHPGIAQGWLAPLFVNSQSEDLDCYESALVEFENAILLARQSTPCTPAR